MSNCGTKTQQELGGREWTIDGSGELIIVERPQGDAMPKTVVSALYNFRDIKGKEHGAAGVAQDETGGDCRGGRGGGRSRRKRSSSIACATTTENKQSGSALRR